MFNRFANSFERQATVSGDKREGNGNLEEGTTGWRLMTELHRVHCLLLQDNAYLPHKTLVEMVLFPKSFSAGGLACERGILLVNFFFEDLHKMSLQNDQQGTQDTRRRLFRPWLIKVKFHCMLICMISLPYASHTLMTSHRWASICPAFL